MKLQRTKLLEMLSCVSPALSGSDLIPVMSHFWFTGDVVMAYNDQIALSTPCKTEFTGAVQGKTLLSLLKASKAKDVEITPSEDELRIRAASSRLKLALLEPENFVFEMPESGSKEYFPVKTKEFLAAIECCMASVSPDTSVPDQLGITLIPDGDDVLLYSTNNITISHVRMPMGAPGLKKRVILSAEFCAQLLKLADPSKKLRLEITEDYSLFTSDRGEILFGRNIEVESPYDFEAILNHHYNKEIEKNLVPIPTKLKLVLERSLIIIDSSTDATTVAVTVSDEQKIKFVSKSERGEVVDSIITEGHPNVNVRLEPKHLKNGYGRFTHMVFTETCAIMVDNNKLYLVAATGE